MKKSIRLWMLLMCFLMFMVFAYYFICLFSLRDVCGEGIETFAKKCDFIGYDGGRMGRFIIQLRE